MKVGRRSHLFFRKLTSDNWIIRFCGLCLYMLNFTPRGIRCQVQWCHCRFETATLLGTPPSLYCWHLVLKMIYCWLMSCLIWRKASPVYRLGQTRLKFYTLFSAVMVKTIPYPEYPHRTKVEFLFLLCKLILITMWSLIHFVQLAVIPWLFL